jgi:uncharacterized protein
LILWSIVVKFKVLGFVPFMILFLPAYSQGHHLVSEVIEPGDIDLNRGQFSEPIEVRIELDRHDPYVHLDYHARTRVHRVCDRCLADYEFALDADGELLFVLGKSSAAGESGEDEIQYIPADAQEIDLTVDLRDALMLSLPLKSLCREDCKGLCPNCGQDLNEGMCNCSS